MKIIVVAKPKRKKVLVVKVDKEHYLVSITEPPMEGRANDGIIKALSKYFNINRNEIFLLSGNTSKIKTYEIPDRLADFEILPKQKSLF